MENGIRIQKVLSEQGIASRRKVEEWITQGKIKVNGRPAVLGQKINPNRDVVAIDGERVYFQKSNQKYYIMLHKPRGYVTTMSDELAESVSPSWWRMCRSASTRLAGWTRTARACCCSPTTAILPTSSCTPAITSPKPTASPSARTSATRRWCSFPPVWRSTAKRPAPPTSPFWRRSPGRVVLQMVIYEGRNRQVRKMCERWGWSRKVKRTALGPLKLGCWPGQVA